MVAKVKEDARDRLGKIRLFELQETGTLTEQHVRRAFEEAKISRWIVDKGIVPHIDEFRELVADETRTPDYVADEIRDRGWHDYFESATGRRKTARAVAHLKYMLSHPEEFPVEEIAQEPVARPKLKGRVIFALCSHCDETDWRSIEHEIVPELPPITGANQHPTVIFFLEEVRKDAFFNGRIDEDEFRRLHRLTTSFEQSEFSRLERGIVPTRSNLNPFWKVLNPFWQAQYGFIAGLVRQGYVVDIRKEEPSYDAAWRSYQTDVFVKEAVRFALDGDMEKAIHSINGCRRAFEESDGERDLHAVPAQLGRVINDVMENHENGRYREDEVTVIVIRGINHYPIADRISIPEGWGRIVKTHEGLPPTALTDCVVDYNTSKRHGAPGAIDLHTALHQDIMTATLRSLLGSGGIQHSRAQITAKGIATRLTAEQIHRLFSSLGNLPQNLVLGERVLELYYRLNANFPEVIGDENRQLFERAIGVVTHGRMYTPRSTDI